MPVVGAASSVAFGFRVTVGHALALLLIGCGGDDEVRTSTGGATSGGSGGCVAGELQLEDGRCLAAGMQENGCAAGEVAVDGGGCRPAGVPPEACGDGFEPDDGGGCTAVLPDSCPPGQMAIPGEMACREVAPCGAAPWGDILVDGSTEFVDAAYAGGGSDGSSAKPWTTIQQGVDAAATGAVVAVAEGSYAEHVLILSKPVRVWGRCPAKVEVVGGAGGPSAASVVVQDADSAEVHGLAVRTGDVGIAVAAEDVLVEGVWIHDTAGPGLYVEDAFGPTRVTLDGSLVETAKEQGVEVIGSEAVIEKTVVRDTRSAGEVYGSGIAMYADPMTKRRASVTALTSVVEMSHGHGVEVIGSDATLDSTVVRDTEPRESDLASGRGVVVKYGSGQRASLTLKASTVERSHDLGLFVAGSDATIEATVVRDTQPRAFDLAFGRGVDVEDDPAAGERSNVAVRSSVVEGNSDMGVYAIVSDVTLEGTVVRDTKPRASDQAGGRGVDVENDPSGGRAAVTLRSCLVEQSHEYGVVVYGSDLTADAIAVRDTAPQASDSTRGAGFAIDGSTDASAGANLTMRASVVERSYQAGLLISGSHADVQTTVVRDTQAQASDQQFGRGIQAQLTLPSGLPSIVGLRACVVERNLDVGIAVVSSQATVDATVVRDTAPRVLDGAFGDGVASIADAGAAHVVVTGSRIEGSARAGVSSFGASMELATTALDCNVIDLDGEEYQGQPWSAVDLGGNVCGCADKETPCKVLSSGLEAPAPIDAPGAP